MATPTAPTPGARCSSTSPEADRAAAAFDLRGIRDGRSPRSAPSSLLPQWDCDGRGRRRGAQRAPWRRGGDHRRQLPRRRARRCGRPSARTCPIAGIVPIAPAGLHMAGWFSAIESEWLIRLLRISPVPVPERIVKPIVGRVYREPRLQRSARRRPRTSSSRSLATSARFARSMGVLDTGRRLMPELSDPFELRADRLPAAADLGRSRPDGLHDRGRACAQDGRLLRHRGDPELRPLPAARGSRASSPSSCSGFPATSSTPRRRSGPARPIGIGAKAAGPLPARPRRIRRPRRPRRRSCRRR